MNLENAGKSPTEFAYPITPLEAEITKALEKKEPALASLFYFSLGIYREKKEPARLAIAAYGIRTVMSELPKYVDTPISNPPTLGNLASTLTEKWTNLIEKTDWPGSPKWMGPIDAPLQGFLAACEIFFEGAALIMPKRRAQAASIIRKHNFGSAPIPAKIESHKAQEWLMYLDFFNKVTHLSSTSEENFLRHLENFENSLINILQPRTFENQARILETIREAEKNAK